MISLQKNQINKVYLTTQSIADSFIMVIQPKKLGENIKEVLLSGDTSLNNLLYNCFQLEVVDDVAYEDLELAKVYLESAEYNYYVYDYEQPFSSSGNTLGNILETGLIQVGDIEETPIKVDNQTTKQNIIL
jgi:hypothetical protein